MTPMNASSLSGSVLRYGNPVVDCDGAWMRALSRQLANVVTVGGSVSAENLDKLTAYVKRFIIDEKPFVLDLSAVDSIAAQADQLLDAVGEACEKAGVEWAMVAGDVVTAVLGGAMPPGSPRTRHCRWLTRFRTRWTTSPTPTSGAAPCCFRCWRQS